MKKYKFESTFVGNTQDEIHCSQACYAMTVARLTGTVLTAEQAEEPTGFRAGKLTWPFAMLDSFSKLGLYVKAIDRSKPQEFADDPVSAIKKMSPGDPENIKRMIQDSDIEKEVRHVKDCLASPLITFESRSALWKDLVKHTVAKDTVVIAWVNYRVLVERKGSVGHFVLVDEIKSDGVVVQDPGPPHKPDHTYPTETFKKAWQWYGEDGAELIIVSTNKIN